MKQNKQRRSNMDLSDCKYYSAFHHLPTFEMQVMPNIGKKPGMAGTESRQKANEFVSKTTKAVKEAKRT